MGVTRGIFWGGPRTSAGFYLGNDERFLLVNMFASDSLGICLNGWFPKDHE